MGDGLGGMAMRNMMSWWLLLLIVVAGRDRGGCFWSWSLWLYLVVVVVSGRGGCSWSWRLYLDDVAGRGRGGCFWAWWLIVVVVAPSAGVDVGAGTGVGAGVGAGVGRPHMCRGMGGIGLSCRRRFHLLSRTRVALRWFLRLPGSIV